MDATTHNISFKDHEQVQNLIRGSRLRVAPFDLHPYDLLEGGSRELYTAVLSSELISSGRPEHARRQTNDVFRIPDFGNRFLRACEQVMSAVEIRYLPPRTRSAHMDSVYTALSLMAPKLQPKAQNDPFKFFIAGGFVVSEILGHNPWGDVDVWFEPRQVGTKWLVATGRGCYPVNILAVTDVLKTIQCYDLDICKCTIECTRKAAGFEFQLLLTRSCVAAYLHTCASLNGLHPVLKHHHRLNARLLKYAQRGLDIEHTAFILIRPEKLEPRIPALPREINLNWNQAVWLIHLYAECISAVSFEILPKAMFMQQTVGKIQSCVPTLLYPSTPSVNPTELAYTQSSEAHWCVRTFAGTQEATIGIPGIGKVSSRYLKPLWLMQRYQLSHTNIVAEIRKHLPRWQGPPLALDDESYLNDESYFIACTQEVQAIDSLVDWKVWRGADFPYGHHQFIWMEPIRSLIIRSHMICHHTIQLVECCKHGKHRPLQPQ